MLTIMNLELMASCVDLNGIAIHICLDNIIMAFKFNAESFGECQFQWESLSQFYNDDNMAWRVFPSYWPLWGNEPFYLHFCYVIIFVWIAKISLSLEYMIEMLPKYASNVLVFIFANASLKLHVFIMPWVKMLNQKSGIILLWIQML